MDLVKLTMHGVWGGVENVEGVLTLILLSRGVGGGAACNVEGE